jgi:hypothetical protein
MPSERHTAMLCWQLRAGLVNHQPPLALGHLEGKVRAEGGQGWALHQQLPGGDGSVVLVCGALDNQNFGRG